MVGWSGENLVVNNMKYLKLNKKEKKISADFDSGDFVSVKKIKSEKAIKDIISQFINPSEYKIFIFGSRATGKARKFSDYDIGIIGKNPIAWEKLSLIDEAFEKSDIPFKVDVVDFSLVSNKFRGTALSKIRKL